MEEGTKKRYRMHKSVIIKEEITQMKKALSCLLIAVMVMSFVLIAISADDDILPYSEQPQAEEEVLVYQDFAAKIDDKQDYSKDSVILVMSKEASVINKEFTKEDFPEISIEKIVDLTYLSNDELINDKDFSEKYVQILQIFLNDKSDKGVRTALDSLSKRSTVDILDASPNYILEFETDSVPNDPYYSNYQSDFANRLHLPQAWNITTGSKNVKVAVVDVGVADHPDLSANLIDGYDVTTRAVPTEPPYTTHGTKVAGVIGAVANNGRGIAGVCWNVTIVPVKLYTNVVTGHDLASSDVVVALTYLNNKGIPIANMSCHNHTYNDALYYQIQNYYGIIVTSAGNYSKSEPDGYINKDINPQYPACYDCDNILSVMGTEYDSTTEQEVKANNSAYGRYSIDIAAPFRVESTTSYDSTHSELYNESGEGTSYASAYVSGVIALMKSVNPEMTPSEIKECLYWTSDSYSSLTNYCSFGSFINAYKAVEYAFQPQALCGKVNNDNCEDFVQICQQNGKRCMKTFCGSSSGHIGQPFGDTYIPIETVSNISYNCQDIVFLEDVNGDGKDDIVFVCNDGGYRRFDVYTGKNNGSFNEAVTTSTNDQISFSSQTFEGNFDGNASYKDILVHQSNANGKRQNLVYKGKPDATFSSAVISTSTNNYIEADSVFVEDIDGDGFDDVIVHWINGSHKSNLLSYHCNLNGSFNYGVNVSLNTDQYFYNARRFFTGDFNGDSFGDFVVQWDDDGTITTDFYAGNSGCSFGNVNSNGSGFLFNAEDYSLAGDFNGDGINDIVFQWSPNAYRYLSSFLAQTTGAFTTSTYPTGHTNSYSSYPIRVFIADIDGDNLDDFIVEFCDYQSSYSEIVYVYRGKNASPYFQSGVISDLSI